MASFAEIKHSLNEVADRIRANQGTINTAKSSVNSAVSNLTDMAADYSQLVADIDAEAAANPTSEAWQLAQNEKDILVAESVSLIRGVKAGVRTSRYARPRDDESEFADFSGRWREGRQTEQK